MARTPGTPSSMPSTPSMATVSASGACRRPLQSTVGKRRDQDERKDHRQIFDDQPADRDPSAFAVDQVPLLQRLEKHDGRGHRKREAEDKAAPMLQPMSGARPRPRPVAPAICTSAPGIAMARTDSRSLSEKWSPTPNIRQDDADLRELLREALVGHEARVCGDQPEHRRPGSRRVAGILNRFASAPRMNASTSAVTMVDISGVSCGTKNGVSRMRQLSLRRNDAGQQQCDASIEWHRPPSSPAGSSAAIS